jgi:hypothetical protein
MRMETIESLRDRLEVLENQTQASAEQMRSAERRLRWWRILACGLLVLGLVILPFAGGTAQEQSLYERALARRLAALEYKLQYISGGANEVVITGANLRIVNGLGETETTNGLGNLIVGYNELRQISNDRTGSHNVVVGSRHNFTSFGGLVVGANNEISGSSPRLAGGAETRPAAPSRRSAGGNQNTASGGSSAVSGGAGNMASGDVSSVSGGSFNQASGLLSWVSGGNQNMASGNRSSVSGGFFNEASGGDSSVSGGFRNMASGIESSVSGGFLNEASGLLSSVSGGSQRSAPGPTNWAAGPFSADN